MIAEVEAVKANIETCWFFMPPHAWSDLSAMTDDDWTYPTRTYSFVSVSAMHDPVR
jgi:hypothetical protein